MKKLLALIFSIFMFCHQCMASQLYFIPNTSRNDILKIVENAFYTKSYTLNSKLPYYGTSKKYGTAIILLEEDIAGLYYYYDGNEKLNNYILKQFNKMKFSYTPVNTALKDSFDNMAQEKVFGIKKSYNFSNNTTTYQSQINNKQNIQQASRTNYQPETSSQNTYQQNYQPNLSYQSQNVLQGYIGQLGVGTEIPAYLQSSLNTETTQKGNKVVLVLSSDLMYNNTVVAPQGSLIYGTVTQARSATYAQRNGKIQIDFNTLQLPSGQTYNISTEKIDFQVEGNEGKANIAGKVIAGAAATALITLAFAALGGSTHIGRTTAIGAGVGAVTVGVAQAAQKGVNAEIPAYTEINLILTKPLSVKMN